LKNTTTPTSIPNSHHISDHDLERYYLGMVTSEEELAPLETHIIGCDSCANRAEATQDYVDMVRVAMLKYSESEFAPKVKKRKKTMSAPTAASSSETIPT